MKILAFDTAVKTAYASISEEKNGTVSCISSYSFVAESHTSALSEMLDSMLRLNKLTVDDIDMFAVSTGPGSFTGIRIGVSVIKGLAFGGGKPCVGVSSLAALTYTLSGIRCITVPLIDARRGTFYSAVFQSDGQGGITRLTPDEQCEADDVIKLLCELSEKSSDRLVFTGDGAEAFAKTAREHGLTPDVILTNPAIGVASLACSDYAKSQNTDEFTDSALRPVYLKKSQAERERDERIAKENA